MDFKSALLRGLDHRTGIPSLQKYKWQLHDNRRLQTKTVQFYTWSRSMILLVVLCMFFVFCRSNIGNDLLYRKLYLPQIIQHEKIGKAQCNNDEDYDVVDKNIHCESKQETSVISLPRKKKSLYVTGGGISGLSFTLGQLVALHDYGFFNNDEFEYYCYSSGCLALIITLFSRYSHSKMKSCSSNKSLLCDGTNEYIFSSNDVTIYERVQDIKYHMDLIFSYFKRIQKGEISTIDAFNSFLHDLLFFRPKVGLYDNNEEFVENIDMHLTSALNSDIFKRINIMMTSTAFGPTIRQPQNFYDLEEYLLQTSWM